LLNSATPATGLPLALRCHLIARDFDLITVEMGYQPPVPRIFFIVMLNAMG
jgi:hypothetical protein